MFAFIQELLNTTGMRNCAYSLYNSRATAKFQQVDVKELIFYKKYFTLIKLHKNTTKQTYKTVF